MSFLENLAKTANNTLDQLAGVAIGNLRRDPSPVVQAPPNNTLPAPVTAPPGVSVSVPFYQRPWFLPVAIGGAVVLAILWIFRK